MSYSDEELLVDKYGCKIKFWLNVFANITDSDNLFLKKLESKQFF